MLFKICIFGAKNEMITYYMELNVKTNGKMINYLVSIIS